MSGAIPLLPLYVFILWKRKNITFNVFLLPGLKVKRDDWGFVCIWHTSPRHNIGHWRLLVFSDYKMCRCYPPDSVCLRINSTFRFKTVFVFRFFCVLYRSGCWCCDCVSPTSLPSPTFMTPFSVSMQLTFLHDDDHRAGYGYQGRRGVWQGRGGGKMGSKLFKLKKGSDFQRSVNIKLLSHVIGDSISNCEFSKFMNYVRYGHFNSLRAPKGLSVTLTVQPVPERPSYATDSYNQPLKDLATPLTVTTNPWET